MKRKSKESILIFHPAKILAFSFASVILIGALLLMLPVSTTKEQISFVDALFTSTSAVCVTGLTVVDTGTYYTTFGQVVILILIQLGGLGIVTLSTFFIWFAGKKISFRGRRIVEGTFAPSPEKEFVYLLKGVLYLTFIIEGAGSLIMWARFAQIYPVWKSLYISVFHAVSAFCNAGFGLFPNNLSDYKSDITVNLVITSLIILGGLGFYVLMELIEYFKKSRGKNSIRRLSLHTKITLTVTAFLIAGGTLCIFLFENGNILNGLSLKSKILISYFQSVTPRTAGFNTVDIGMLTNPTLFLMLLLMFVGASPGSTGGGVKTTSFGVLMALVISKLKGSDSTMCFRRTISNETIAKVISVIVASTFGVVIITMALCITEEHGLSYGATKGIFLEILFEVISAFGTVGLSMGITSSLSDAGKLLITLMMFIGRVGPLAIVVVMGQKESTSRYTYPEESLMIG